MGWLFCTDWETQKQLETHLDESLSSHVKLLDTCSRYGEYYQLVEITVEKGERIESTMADNQQGIYQQGEVIRTVFCYMISSQKQYGATAFGYKCMGITCMPFMFNATKKIVDRVNDKHIYAIKWVSKCNEHRETMNLKRRVVRGLVKGQKIILGHSDEVYTFIRLRGSAPVLSSSKGVFYHPLSNLPPITYAI